MRNIPNECPCCGKKLNHIFKMYSGEDNSKSKFINLNYSSEIDAINYCEYCRYVEYFDIEITEQVRSTVSSDVYQHIFDDDVSPLSKLIALDLIYSETHNFQSRFIVLYKYIDFIQSILLDAQALLKENILSENEIKNINDAITEYENRIKEQAKEIKSVIEQEFFKDNSACVPMVLYFLSLDAARRANDKKTFDEICEQCKNNIHDEHTKHYSESIINFEKTLFKSKNTLKIKLDIQDSDFDTEVPVRALKPVLENSDKEIVNKNNIFESNFDSEDNSVSEKNSVHVVKEDKTQPFYNKFLNSSSEKKCLCCGKIFIANKSKKLANMEINDLNFLNSSIDFIDSIDMCPHCGFIMISENETEFLDDETVSFMNQQHFQNIIKSSHIDVNVKKWFIFSMLLSSKKDYKFAAFAAIKAYDLSEQIDTPLTHILNTAINMLSKYLDNNSGTYLDILILSDCLRRKEDFWKAEELLDLLIQKNNFDFWPYKILVKKEKYWIENKYKNKRILE